MKLSRMVAHGYLPSPATAIFNPKDLKSSPALQTAQIVIWVVPCITFSVHIMGVVNRLTEKLNSEVTSFEIQTGVFHD